MADYVLLKDVVIPAGTILKDAPFKTIRVAPHKEALIGLTKDSCASFIIDPEEDPALKEWIAEVK